MKYEHFVTVLQNLHKVKINIEDLKKVYRIRKNSYPPLPNFDRKKNTLLS